MPRKKFLFRLILPAFLIYLLSSAFIGEFTHYYFPAEASGRGVVATVQVQTKFIESLYSMPFYCRIGESLVSEQHKSECAQITDRILVTGLTGGFPFLVVLFFMVFGFFELTSLYCLVTEHVSSGKMTCLGRYECCVERRDWFATLFCLKPIEIRDDHGQSLKVYLAGSERQLPPGARVAVFDVGRWFFFQRKFGVVDLHAISMTMSQRV